MPVVLPHPCTPPARERTARWSEVLRHASAWSLAFVFFFGLAWLDERTAPAPSRCSIELERLSYDDPGTDDEEWLELAVRGRGSAVSFGDCGVGALELVNADDATCSAARRIELGELALPAGDRLVVCSNDSRIGAAVGCDVSRDSSGELRNGWIQNGPELVRLVGSDEQELWSVAYGSGGTCPAALQLPKEQGAIETGEGEVDDVLARCDEEFVRLPATLAPPRKPAVCPEPPGEGAESAPPPAATSEPAAPTSMIEPAPRSSVAPTEPAATAASVPIFPRGHVLDSGVTLVSSAEWAEAGTPAAEPEDAEPMRPPPSLPDVACALHPSVSRAGRFGLAGYGLWAACTLLWLRRRPARPALLRARCAARCDCRSRRSP